MSKVKIIIAGSRDFSDYNLLEEVVTSVLRNTAWKKGYKNSDIEIVCGKPDVLILLVNGTQKQ